MSAGTTVQITMPEMGESVTEGTVLEWLKQVGDQVEVDEGLLEVSTDKVDAEVPSPASGVLTEILVGPDETVPTGTVLGIIDVSGGNGAAPKGHDDLPPEKEHQAAKEKAAGALVDVTVPSMGESVSEGTVLEWLKNVGDRVERDEGLVEISTDKVDAELPSPVSGTLAEILVQPDDVVAVGTVVCRIAADEGAPRAEPKPAARVRPARVALFASRAERDDLGLALRPARALQRDVERKQDLVERHFRAPFVRARPRGR